MIDGTTLADVLTHLVKASSPASRAIGHLLIRDAHETWAWTLSHPECVRRVPDADGTLPSTSE